MNANTFTTLEAAARFVEATGDALETVFQTIPAEARTGEMFAAEALLMRALGRWESEAEAAMSAMEHQARREAARPGPYPADGSAPQSDRASSDRRPLPDLEPADSLARLYQVLQTVFQVGQAHRSSREETTQEPKFQTSTQTSK